MDDEGGARTNPCSDPLGVGSDRVHASSDHDRPYGVHEPTQPDETIASGDLGHEGSAFAREDALDAPVATHLVAVATDRGIEGADHLHGGALIIAEVAIRVRESRPFEAVNGDPAAANVACVFGVGALSGVVTDHDRASRDQQLGASPNRRRSSTLNSSRPLARPKALPTSTMDAPCNARSALA